MMTFQFLDGGIYYRVHGFYTASVRMAFLGYHEFTCMNREEEMGMKFMEERGTEPAS